MAILNIFIVLGLLSIMIIVHEFGHWIVARKLGFQTPIFGFGLPFGSHVRIGRWKETEFRFHWFVLGGYVAIPELGDETKDELVQEMPNLKPLQSFPVWKRAAVASAGVVFNIIFAYFACLVMVATIGPPSSKGNVMITSLLASTSDAKDYNTEPNAIAEKAGLKIKDIIVSANGKGVNKPSDIVDVVSSHKLKPVTLLIQRTHIKDNKKSKELIKVIVIPNKEGRIGVGLGIASNGEYDKPSKNPFIWISQAAQILFEWSFNMLIGLMVMFANLLGFSPFGGPKVKADDLHGIIAIVSVFSQALAVDFREIYRWTVLISMNLAIVNLLPIPALDGGHLLFMIIEKVRGRKLAESFQQKAIQAGFMLLMLLMVFVLFNDIRGLVSGKFDMNK